MSMTIEHTGQHLDQLHGAQLAGGCIACHDYLTAQAEAAAPTADQDPAEADPAEAEPAMRFWVKIKAYGMWGVPTYFATYEEALAVIDAVPNPAIAVSIETGMVSRNLEAVAAGVELDAPSSPACPIHGAGCEAWA